MRRLAGGALGAILVFSSFAGAAELREFAVDLEYPSFGAAPQPPRPGFIPMKSGAEKEFASWAIVNGLMHLGNIVEDVSLAAVIPPEKDWMTNVAPLDRSTVEDYNAKVVDPELKLPRNRLYGLQHSGQYLILNDQLRFKIGSVLYHRGSDTDYIPYDAGSYSDDYFFERAIQAIKDALRQFAAEKTKPSESPKP